MQMSKMYESTNNRIRAGKLRASGKELQLAGFELLASLNFEEADWIDPPPREIRHD